MIGFPKPRPSLLVKAAERKLKRREAMKLRQDVRARDGNQCQCCHVTVSLGYANPLQHAHVHHITFRSQGGADVMKNLVTVCAECHAKIHAREIDVIGSHAKDVRFVKRRKVAQ